MYGHGDTIFNWWNPAFVGLECGTPYAYSIGGPPACTGMGTPYAYSIGGPQHVRAWGVGHHMHIQ